MWPSARIAVKSSVRIMSAGLVATMMVARSSSRLLRPPEAAEVGVARVSGRVVISVDAMGGDNAPGIVIEGLRIAKARFPRVHYLVFGDQAKIQPLLAAAGDLREHVEIRHTDQAVAPDAKPSQVLRTGRQSSMSLAIEAVAKGEASGIVSAGNTGALMAVSKFRLRTLPGIDRPAIAAFFPTQRGESVMLRRNCSPYRMRKSFISSARAPLPRTAARTGNTARRMMLRMGLDPLHETALTRHATPCPSAGRTRGPSAVSTEIRTNLTLFPRKSGSSGPFLPTKKYGMIPWRGRARRCHAPNRVVHWELSGTEPAGLNHGPHDGE